MIPELDWMTVGAQEVRGRTSAHVPAGPNSEPGVQGAELPFSSSLLGPLIPFAVWPALLPAGIQSRPGPVEGRDSVRYSCTANIGLRPASDASQQQSWRVGAGGLQYEGLGWDWETHVDPSPSAPGAAVGGAL